MTVKEKLKQEEEKLLESVNNSYRDMMRAQFDCIFEELEERCEKSPEYAARVLLPHKSFTRCMKYAMKKIMEIRTPTEKEKELARKQEAPIVTPVSSDVLFEWIDEYYELDDKEAYEKEMQKQEAAQTSKKKKQTVKKPAKPLLDNLLGKEGGDTPDLKPSKAKKSRRKELDGQLSLFQIEEKMKNVAAPSLCGRAGMPWTGILSLSAVTKRKCRQAARGLSGKGDI